MYAVRRRGAELNKHGEAIVYTLCMQSDGRPGAELEKHGEATMYIVQVYSTSKIPFRVNFTPSKMTP